MTQIQIDLAQLLATIVLGFLAALIAYRQWRTSHQQVVLDLFERRMTVYENARAVIGEIMRDGAADTDTLLRYVRATDRLPMLFGDDVEEYSRKVYNRINKLSYYTTILKDRAGPDIGAAVEKRGELFTELGKFYEEFAALIVPYVRMTQKLR